jgi:Domain of unknown function (DUF3850)
VTTQPGDLLVADVNALSGHLDACLDALGHTDVSSLAWLRDYQASEAAAARRHELRTVQPYFDAVASGAKTFEVRRDDRPGGFQVGDVLWLREYHPAAAEAERYTGRSCWRQVTYVMRSGTFGFGLLPGTAVLGLAVIPEQEVSW